MKRKIFALLSLICITLLSACYDDVDEIFYIGLEKESILLQGEYDTGTVVVNTDVSIWGIATIRTENELYGNTFKIKEENGNRFKVYRDTMACEWVEVIKVNPKELLVKAKENLSGEKRSITVLLSNFRSSVSLVVTQEAK